ncbi:FAD-binding protein [Mycolicibacterium moriokaense]|uniref:FAD-binding protein n=1 Tax=Mycolicibacterium moriokaense TaxID=39691 RepID=A0AAD1HFV4_9MYCO|nr:FAD-binding oxidoreductase [Mycolicibacterium moriokaense]MCV7041939.1 FAD-binding oxidoreductase [Mycolicibacterium moriokaense]ORB12800.1 FAD-binding protein [Mycolicibacterium moriokaense]BBX04705.1 FAD-binding protein [Mycolicibacterium moriokaense]
MGTTVNTTLTGDVVRQGDSGYDAARLGYNHLFRHRPEAIVYCNETQDVVNALSWARQNEVAVRVRSGGHCLEGWSSIDDGLVIDVSRIKSAEIDTSSNTATVGAGLNQLEAVTTLGAAGCAAPTGTEGTVGLVGATLGGGFGLLTRNFGMASDNLLAAEIVVAPAGSGAETIVADEENNADLLWALRGAGNGNFGIVTTLTYRTYPLTQTIYVTATWTGLDDLSEVYEAWQQSAPYTDNRLTSQLEIRRDEFVLIALLASGSESEAESLLSPILSVGKPNVVVTDANWADTYAGFQIPPADELANWKFLSQFIYEPYPAEAVNIVKSFMAQAPTPESNYFTNAFGGAVKDSEPADGSAFVHRNALYYAEPGAGWGTRGGLPASEDPLTATCEAWIKEFGEALQPYVNGAYVNVPNAGMPGWEAAYWGANVDRLRTVKAKYDPDNVFNYEQSVQVSP